MKRKLPPMLMQRPSRLIRRALGDNILCAKDKRFKKKTCPLHNAIFEKTLRADPDFEDKNTSLMITALEHFSKGEIMYGLHKLGIELPFGLVDKVKVSSYDREPKQFRRNMLQIAQLLEGLRL